MPDVPPPYVLAVILCDHIWRDPTTGKPSLMGCFSVLFATTFPASNPTMSVYIATTNGRGKVPVTLRVVDADEEQEPLFQQVTEIEFADPRTVFEMEATITNLTFPAPGEYRFQIYAGATLLMERRILVIQTPVHPPQETQS